MNEIKSVLYVLGFSLLTALAANIKIPFFPYHPVTPQLIFVLLSGALLGSFRGPLSQVLFVALGLAGLPWFNELAPAFPVPSFQASPEFIKTGLKAGWFEGFVGASYLAGKTIEYARRVDLYSLSMAMLGGLIVLYVTGLVFPAMVLRIPLSAQFLNWVVRFFLMDLVKAILALVFLVNLYRIPGITPRIEPSG